MPQIGLFDERDLACLTLSGTIVSLDSLINNQVGLLQQLGGSTLVLNAMD
jgi:hypothetical protein